MRIHLPSVAIGIAAAVAILITMSQAAPTGMAYPPRIEYGPHPRDMVQIVEGTPFIVPAGQIFVLTAMGTTFGNGNCILQLNGQTSELGAWNASGSTMGMHEVPMGFTVPAGSSISLLNQSNPGTARAWGYLSK